MVFIVMKDTDEILSRQRTCKSGRLTVYTMRTTNRHVQASRLAGVIGDRRVVRGTDKTVSWSQPHFDHPDMVEKGQSWRRWSERCDRLLAPGRVQGWQCLKTGRAQSALCFS
jgi:hypothetical protein